MRKFYLSFATLLMLSSVANAGDADTDLIDLRLRSELASGPVYGGPTQNAVTCYLFNAGDRKKGIKSKEIFGQGSSTPVNIVADSCGNELDAKSICVIEARGINNTIPYACKFTFKDKDNFIRGEIELRYEGTYDDPSTYTVLKNLTLD